MTEFYISFKGCCFPGSRECIRGIQRIILF
nr:MAG TPA: Protein MS5 [Caudoviricetes sp.]DAV28698.1 MAG TPA: Protein MS5 [Caudoviricetes sp.]